MTNKDAFDLWWAWAEKPPHSTLTIPAEIHEAVMALPPNERHDRAKVNEAVREGLQTWPAAAGWERRPVRRSESGRRIEKLARERIGV